MGDVTRHLLHPDLGAKLVALTPDPTGLQDGTELELNVQREVMSKPMSEELAHTKRAR